MSKSVRKVWYKRMWVYSIGGILLVLVIYLVVQGIRCRGAVAAGEERLAAYEAETARLSYGDMTYVDQGEGETILIWQEIMIIIKLNPYKCRHLFCTQKMINWQTIKIL